MIDEKRCYYFGRNPKSCDFTVDHASCSRVHSALLYHKHLDRAFLIDLGSSELDIVSFRLLSSRVLSASCLTEFCSAAHGTFIGNVRLEAEKPEQVLVEQDFHFGASTRRYVLRERPRAQAYSAGAADDSEDSDPLKTSAKLLGLPEKEDELEVRAELSPIPLLVLLRPPLLLFTIG